MLRLITTVGVNETLKKNQGFWLADVIYSFLPRLVKAEEYFAVALLYVENREAKFILCGDIEESQASNIYAEQRIPWTDYPEGKHKFYVGLADENIYTLMLPEEY